MMDQSPTFDEKEENVRKNFWQKLKQFVGRVPFAEDLVTVYYCAMDPATPTYVRSILLGALAYFILPVDLVPDAVIGLGFTDDASVLAAAIKAVVGHLKPAHRLAARQVLERLRNGSATNQTV